MKQFRLLSLMLLALLLPRTVQADSTFSGGDGSSTNQYLISTIADLDQLARDVNAGNSYKGKYFVLTDDLDYSSAPVTNNTNYTPIGRGKTLGTDEADCPFEGVFDGWGHDIKGIMILVEDGVETNRCYGIFGYNNGQIRNLRLVESVILGHIMTGGIVGHNDHRGIVYNCHVLNSTIGAGNDTSYRIGGIVGFNYGTIEGCTISGHVDGKGKNFHMVMEVGGIVGNAPQGTIRNCLVAGADVTCQLGHGAIAGQINEEYAKFEKCYYVPVKGNAISAIGDGPGASYDVEGTAPAVAQKDEPAGLGSVVFDYPGFEKYFNLIIFENCMFWKYNGQFYLPENDDTPQFPLYEGDEGTQAKPFQIKTKEDMEILAKNVNKGKNFKDMFFALMADIDFGGGTETNYTPVGKYNSYNDVKVFSGTFDGQGHTISGIYIKKTSWDDSDGHQALFAVISSGGAVRNLTLANSFIYGYECNAGITGSLESGAIIENCHVLSNVTIGGLSSQLAGIASSLSGTMVGCTNAAAINGELNYNFSGLAAGGSSAATMTDCLNLGAVNGPRSKSGIAGTSYIKLSNNYYAGNCTTGGVRGYDTYGAKKAQEFTEAPANLGNKLKEYQAFAGAPAVIAYENGLFYDGKYYFSDRKPTKQFPLYSGDEGTEEKPFQIKSKEDMNKLTEDVNFGTDYNDMWFALASDLDYGGGTETNYTPIGNCSSYFRGNFDGQGHVISGIVINSTGDSDLDSYVGVFGCYEDGYEGLTLRNLTLANSTIYGFDDVAGFGGSFMGIMENCHVLDVTLTTDFSGSHIGGLAGNFNGHMKGCTSAAVVTNSAKSCYFTGGVCGAAMNGTMTDCLSMAEVNGNNEKRIGSIAGDRNTITFSNTYYVAPSTLFAIAGADFEGIVRAYPSASKPESIGAEGTVYKSYANAPGVTAYEHGLFYDGKYYSADGSSKPGDMTGDDKLDAKDVVTMVKIFIGMLDDKTGAADVNGDGVVNISDLILLINLIYLH